jgi:hypothetical protein
VEREDKRRKNMFLRSYLSNDGLAVYSQRKRCLFIVLETIRLCNGIVNGGRYFVFVRE